METIFREKIDLSLLGFLKQSDLCLLGTLYTLYLCATPVNSLQDIELISLEISEW